MRSVPQAALSTKWCKKRAARHNCDPKHPTVSCPAQELGGEQDVVLGAGISV